MEEAEKKACEDLETERARSRSLSDDVDRLREALREKEDIILQLGMLIEDLRVEKTELVCSHKRIERANTDLVGQNIALEEKISCELSSSLRLLSFCGICFYRLIPYFDLRRA